MVVKRFSATAKPAKEEANKKLASTFRRRHLRWERERESECVSACVWALMCVCVCVSVAERERVCVCVCIAERERDLVENYLFKNVFNTWTQVSLWLMAGA
jgi:hypothetical protein